MKERPILFSGDMVRAILDRRKRMTRRIVNERDRRGIPHESIVSATVDGFTTIDGAKYPLPRRFEVGDRLWVKETWQAIHVSIDPETGYGDDVDAAEAIPSDSREGYWSVAYDATDPDANIHKSDRGFSWRPSIFMPRWASRITLEVTDVRVERLQDITDDDARAEGVAVSGDMSARSAFALLWDSINADRAPWASNPWVRVVSFERMAE